MIVQEFNGYFDELVAAFGSGRPPSAETRNAYFKRLKHYDSDAWTAGVERIIHEDDRFPRIKRCLEATELARQELKRKEIWRNHYDPSGGVKEIIEKLPFPEKLRDALHLRWAGKLDQEGLEAICQMQTPERKTPCDYGCIEGYVHYELDQGNGRVPYTAICNCELGELLTDKIPKINEVMRG